MVIFIVVDVAARSIVPAKLHRIEQLPLAKVLILACVKIPPVLSCATTVPTVQVAGVELVTDKRCPKLASPEFCPLA